MKEKIEGTIVLDGLVEGRFADDPEAEDKLRKWVRFMSEMGVGFSLDWMGASFSLLPDEGANPTQQLGSLPHDAIRQALDQLLELLPTDQRGGVFSTLRSAEYRKDEEVQAIYAVGPDGKTQVETRTVDADTVAPPQPISTGDRVKSLGLGLLVAAALLGITSLFVDLRGLFGEFMGSITPVEPQAVQVDLGDMKDFLAVEKRQMASRGRLFVLTLKRTTDYPRDDAQLQAAYDASAGDVRRRLAVEAIARERVRCELFDEKGKFVAARELRIGSLKKKESIDVAIPLGGPKDRFRLGRVVMTY